MSGRELPENARREKVYARVPEGEPLPTLPSGTRIVELVKEIYGLPPGPRAWRNTFLHVCKELDFTIHPLSACVLTWYGKTNGSKKERTLKGVLLLQVDDILVAGEGEEWKRTLGKLRQRFTCGKWVSLMGSYRSFNGREIRQQGDYSFQVSMQQYIATLSELEIPSSRERKQDASATMAEQTQF
eukprot:4388114-Amphidinium_carterae.1